ncbi:restriction endonuclease subunit S [Halorhodospira halochloris]|uniref:restriction endonuclease subunit S n=1 Tax=Halorhodospira halochloris TaxID=1052 RepID=UPI001EE8E689|nr:restriction endonuclease subunit S [Halorhodospira halochloris]MCG5549121.1 restriction endonuclease subunit S [Halorhodospira halochloris]
MTVSANERVIADEQARHWRKRKLKFVSDVRTSNVDKHIVEGEAAVRLCNYTDVYYNEKITPDMPFMQGSATESEVERFGLKKGQVLLTKDSESWEDIAVPAYVSETMPEVVCGYHLAVIEPDSGEVDGRFLSWLAQSPVLNDQFKLSAKGVTRFGLSQHALKNAVIDVPPLEYQLKAAAFLDRKTAEIDTLIAKKRRLLDRLAEKRTALITRAVTKGLNPDAPMKESGIEWLGEIPAHWRVSRVKFFAAVGNGSTPSRENADYWVGGDYPWLNSGVVNKASVTEADQFVTKSALRECHLPIIDPPAILLGITGQGKTRGMATKLEIQATINQHLVFVKPDERVFDIDYLYAIFERAYLYLRSESDGGGSTKGAITCGQVENLCVPLPPVSEQREIALALQESQAKLHGVSRKIVKVIERLEEYRSALITNAVTGQIKVA